MQAYLEKYRGKLHPTPVPYPTLFRENTRQWKEGDYIHNKCKVQCRECLNWYSSKTNASGWSAHLKKQSILPPRTEDESARKRLAQQKLLKSVPSKLHRVFEAAIVDFVISGVISLQLAVKNSKFLSTSWHRDTSSRPRERQFERIVELYNVVLPAIGNLVSNLDVSFSLTIDG
jgi:hypothetical protein